MKDSKKLEAELEQVVSDMEALADEAEGKLKEGSTVKQADKKEKDPHINEDGTFKGGFDGCVEHMMECKGHDKESAVKLCGWIKSHVAQGVSATEAADAAIKQSVDSKLVRSVIKQGGPGSGNFGHAGRPGERGGSAPSGEGGSAEEKGPKASWLDLQEDYLKKELQLKDMRLRHLDNDGKDVPVKNWPAKDQQKYQELQKAYKDGKRKSEAAFKARRKFDESPAGKKKAAEEDKAEKKAAAEERAKHPEDFEKGGKYSNKLSDEHKAELKELSRSAKNLSDAELLSRATELGAKVGGMNLTEDDNDDNRRPLDMANEKHMDILEPLSERYIDRYSTVIDKAEKLAKSKNESVSDRAMDLQDDLNDDDVIPFMQLERPEDMIDFVTADGGKLKDAYKEYGKAFKTLDKYEKKLDALKMKQSIDSKLVQSVIKQSAQAELEDEDDEELEPAIELCEAEEDGTVDEDDYDEFFEAYLEDDEEDDSELIEQGGPGSGFFGHAGRPGQVGGSSSEGGSGSEKVSRASALKGELRSHEKEGKALAKDAKAVLDDLLKGKAEARADHAKWGKLNKKEDKLFKKLDKKDVPNKEQEKIWAKKFESKFDKLEKRYDKRLAAAKDGKKTYNKLTKALSEKADKLKKLSDKLADKVDFLNSAKEMNAYEKASYKLAKLSDGFRKVVDSLDNKWLEKLGPKFKGVY